ncbi:hypothetical protein Pint_16525 [Pistacia integerrima]|uniref:Uncharacterized protein n=1 Tax=Pistacia integerrima TaxID=434235 RepID=A0ACC0ZED9_9ROSI|nr:hypothetical protein Pint_16525 [Pistacia integerrima]
MKLKYKVCTIELIGVTTFWFWLKGAMLQCTFMSYIKFNGNLWFFFIQFDTSISIKIEVLLTLLIKLFSQLKVRAAVEMALIDAVANSISMPLWRLFGGATNNITTDITLKVGKNLKADIEVLQAIRAVHPDCSFILDANEGYKPNEAIEVLEKLYEMGVIPVLFEQPVHRDDWEGLGLVSHIAKDKYGVSVAADESCRGLHDVKKIIKGNLADVINIKLAKVGVLGALEIIEEARASGLDLMIGGMVETRLAMGFAGHLAAGLGCFKFIDLDTPLLLAEDPVLEGYEVSGAVYKFANARGHGGFLHWDNLACSSGVVVDYGIVYLFHL